jgi:hypothetical protein
LKAIVRLDEPFPISSVVLSRRLPETEKQLSSECGSGNVSNFNQKGFDAGLVQGRLTCLREYQMRQKYRICQLTNSESINIKEFAVIEKDTKNLNSAMLRQDHFDLVCEQDYPRKDIANAMAAGLDQLVEALRTTDFYPIEPYVNKIAETVIDITSGGEDRCVDLFFDDKELFVSEQNVE